MLFEFLHKFWIFMVDTPSYSTHSTREGKCEVLRLLPFGGLKAEVETDDFGSHDLHTLHSD